MACSSDNSLGGFGSQPGGSEGKEQGEAGWLGSPWLHSAPLDLDKWLEERKAEGKTLDFEECEGNVVDSSFEQQYDSIITF